MAAVISGLRFHHAPHVELMRACIREAAAYCRKDADHDVPGCVVYECGTQVVAGKSTAVATAM